MGVVFGYGREGNGCGMTTKTTTCDICGAARLGKAKPDIDDVGAVFWGHFAIDRMRIGWNHYDLCPNCMVKVEDAIENIKQEVKGPCRAEPPIPRR